MMTIKYWVLLVIKHLFKKFKNEVDAFIWFDSDMIFPDNTIAILIAAHKASEY